jgi:hypothetical protein
MQMDLDPVCIEVALRVADNDPTPTNEPAHSTNGQSTNGHNGRAPKREDRRAKKEL